MLEEFMFAGKSVWITILSETFYIFTLGYKQANKTFIKHLAWVLFWSSALLVSPPPRVKVAG